VARVKQLEAAVKAKNVTAELNVQPLADLVSL
jgi:hypothetical protein